MPEPRQDELEAVIAAILKEPALLGHRAPAERMARRAIAALNAVRRPNPVPAEHVIREARGEIKGPRDTMRLVRGAESEEPGKTAQTKEGRA